MVQIIERPPSFGERLGRSLGGGLGKGFSDAMTAMVEKKKTESLLKSLGLSPSSSKNFGNQAMNQQVFEEYKNEYKNLTGSEPSKEEQADFLTKLNASTSQPGEIRPEALIALSKEDPSLVPAVKSIYEQQEQRKTVDIKETRKRLEKPLEEARVAREQLAGKKMDIDLFKSSIQHGTGTFSQANMIRLINQVSGKDLLQQNASGSQMAFAGKNYLINSLSKVGARGLNQYLEKQLSQAQPKIGASDKANMAVMLPIEAGYDIEKFKLDTLGGFQDFYESRGLQMPTTILRQAEKATAEYADKRLRLLSYQVQENLESGLDDRKVMHLDSKGAPEKVIPGTPLTERNARLFVDKYGESAEKVAKSLGYNTEDLGV